MDMKKHVNFFFSYLLVWPVPLAQVWTHYKKGNSTCEHCFAMYVSIFWTAKYERKSCLNWMVSLQVLPHSFQNLVFWSLFEFSVAEITFKSIFPTFWIQILPNKFHEILLIKIFPTRPKAHPNSSKIFNYDFI